MCALSRRAFSRCVFRRYVFSQRVFSRRAFSRCVFARCVFGACERRWTGGWGIKKKGARDERWCCPVVAVNSHVSRCRAARRASVAPAPSAGSSRRTYSTRASAAAASSRRRSTARRLWNATGWVLLDGLSVSLPFSLFLLPCVRLFFSLARYLPFSVCILCLTLTYSCVCISISFLLTRAYSVHRERHFLFLARPRIPCRDRDQPEGRRSWRSRCRCYVRWACTVNTISPWNEPTVFNSDTRVASLFRLSSRRCSGSFVMIRPSMFLRFGDISRCKNVQKIYN